MIKLLNKYNRWLDPIRISEFETWFSLCLTALFIFLLSKLDFYHNFYVYSEIVQSLLVSICTIMVGFIGVSLSGVAIITGLFSHKQIQIIEKYNGKDSFERIMSCFAFLALSAGVYVIYLMAIIILITAPLPMVNVLLFWAMVIFAMYFFFFNMFYTVALVANCIKIFQVRNVYSEVEEYEKHSFGKANELRLDSIIKTITDKYDIEKADFLDELKAEIEKTNISDNEK